MKNIIRIKPFEQQTTARYSGKGISNVYSNGFSRDDVSAVDEFLKSYFDSRINPSVLNKMSKNQYKAML